VRIAILDARMPAAADAEGLAERLRAALEEHGHATEIVRIPFIATAADDVVAQTLAMRLIHLENVERAIGLSFPARHVPHGDKLAWLVHEDCGAPLRAGAAADRRVRAAVRAADRAFLGEARRLYTGCAATSRRLRREVGLEAQVLPPPAPTRDAGARRCDGACEHAPGVSWETVVAELTR
jgi:hypothetical protein